MRAQVAVVDDHPLFRQGLVVALRGEADLEVVGEVGSAEEAIELAKHLTLDVVVVDLLMPTMSGISLTSQLFEIQPRCRVLGLSVIDEPGLIADMLRAHACGFALKTQPPSEIVDAVRQVLGGLRYLPPGVSRDAIDTELAGTRARPFRRLTPREREVFGLVVDGLPNKRIAGKLGTSEKTVKVHRARVMEKMGAGSLAALVKMAYEAGEN